MNTGWLMATFQLMENTQSNYDRECIWTYERMMQKTKIELRSGYTIIDTAGNDDPKDYISFAGGCIYFGDITELEERVCLN